MRRIAWSLAVLWFASAATQAQETPDAAAQAAAEAAAEQAAAEAAAAEEAVSQRAAQLEADLGKLRDDTPEAAALLLELIDLYHAEGRVFGLIRSGEAFIARHPLHERHAEAMLKYIDGLAAMSRNRDLVGQCRQFLTRYPESAECPRLEQLLAATLDQMNDRQQAAAAYEGVWRRQPDTAAGREAGVRAVNYYAAINALETYTAAAVLAEAVLDHYPAGELASEAGQSAVYNWIRSSEWAKSNAVANKLLAKGLPAAPTELKQLHMQMAENYGRLGLRTNAVESYTRARALGDSPYLLRQIIVEMYNGAAKGADLEAPVNEYFLKYADREDRFPLRSYLALAYLRDGDKPRALSILAELLPFDAVTNGNASVYARENGVEPAQLAQTEQVLAAALQANTRDAYYLRWVLGLEHYRDRVKDEAKARAVARDLVLKSPSNDSYSAQALSWLLFTAPSEAEFQADVVAWLKVRSDYFQWGAHRGYLASWIQQAMQTPEQQARAAWAKARLDEADQQPLIRDWLAAEDPNRPVAEAARFKLLASDSLPNLTDLQARALFDAQGYSLYYNGTNEERARSATMYASMARRFPQDYGVALWYLQSAAGYSPPEVAKEAALHLLTLEPQDNASNYAAWYQLMTTADRLQDGEFARTALAWIVKGRQAYPLSVNLTYSDSIGDILERLGLKAEALDHWRWAVEHDRNSSYSRSCAGRVAARLEGPERIAYLTQLNATVSDTHGAYAMLLADEQLKALDLDAFEKTLRDSMAVQAQRPFRPWGMEEYPPQTWVDQYRANLQATVETKRRVFTVVRDLRIGTTSAAAQLALLELPSETPPTPIGRLLAYQAVSTMTGDESHQWDRLIGYAQAAMSRRDYVAVAALGSGMLANITNIDVTRQQTGRDMVAQSYARMGSVGLAIDENSPVAPLMQAALYLRLGDTRLALEAYTANRALFDEHRYELPVDLILFVCDSHIAAGGEENYERVEDILRGWLVKFSEAMDLDNSVKAQVQLMLAKNYFRAQRYDVARSEYTTVINRYADTPEAIEAEFGIGESFMAQKVYDQAEAAFEKLSANRDRDVVIRAEFLRGVLANRRGDLDEARDIFRGVLEMVPSVELADQALYNLAEVYGAEQRYMDQLELLRTVGRLGRNSKRWHTPGVDLSIVVQDSDLGISRGHSKIPVRVTTQPGGDEETIYLFSGGAGKGLFRADVPTRLGEVSPGDKVLQLTGQDVIYCDYPDEFKSEFRSVPLSDAEIRIAANAKLEVASAKIVDEQEETFSQRLEREAREERDRDLRVSQVRPANQIKPGNPVYFRVQDPDRDLSNQPDTITVKLAATSGDQVQVTMTETGPHTGVFEGTSPTGELPAGALASDTSIDHNPLMAIDQDPATFWLSEPDGATPKWLSVDMKDLRIVDHVTIASPDGAQHAPVRGRLEGSHDGRFWFRLASIPPEMPVEVVAAEGEQMTQRVYAGNYLGFTAWQQIVDLTKNNRPIEEDETEQLSWSVPADAANANEAHAVVWHGKFVQPRSGAIRFAVQAARSAIAIDRQLELPLGDGARTVDVWLEQGTHDLTIFAAVGAAVQGVVATRAREDLNAEQVVLSPFRGADFDLTQTAARPALPRAAAEVQADHGVWDFRFDEIDLRHVRVMIDEYLGEAVAIGHVEIRGSDDSETHIPTEADVLALAGNATLEIAAGDVITATYTDEFTQTAAGRSQLLTANLTATYFNARVTPIAYDFRRAPDGQVYTERKRLIRIDPGERVVVEVIDYDLDSSGEPDKLDIQVAVNDGEPITFTAQETRPHSGEFTKEVDTSAKPAEGKLHVKPGDRLYISYVDSQNTFPGHSLARETVVYVNQPSEGRVRIVETRIVPPPEDAPPNTAPQVIYLPPGGRDRDADQIANVAFEAPLTVEVFDRDAAKDSRSSLVVQLETTDGAKIDVRCVVSEAFSGVGGAEGTDWALEEGRFVGQVVLQLGSRNSPDVVPLASDMPRNLIGRAVLPDDISEASAELVTRVLNLTGKDTITATYEDALRPDGAAKPLTASGRLIANGVLACTDRDYDRPVTQLHVGERMFLMVTDADVDVSDQRDLATIEIATERGEKEQVALVETLSHSGVFTGSVLLKPADSPTAGNVAADDPEIETYFGDTVTLRYVDKAASTETGTLEQELVLPVVIGTDGLVNAFSKTFGDETLAVETQFHIAESYFELFKSHKKLERGDDLRGDLEAGRRVLREVMEDYPDPKYVPRTAYLLGQFAQELGQWTEAIDAYRMIVRQYPDHSLAVDAQYKLAQCHEEAGDYDESLEAYVTLAATYPKSPLIANVMIRISERFYKEEEYEVAAQVGTKFLERFDGHEWAPRMAFRVGQCYYKAKEYREAATAFDRFAKVFPDDELCADALFWAGESYRMASDNSQAFRRYNRCRWDFPASESARYARGRLALPAMLQQFEIEANVEDE